LFTSASTHNWNIPFALEAHDANIKMSYLFFTPSYFCTTSNWTPVYFNCVYHHHLMSMLQH